MAPLLDWSGRALVDVGIAALCAMSNRQDPKQLTLDDFDSAAREMERYYFSGRMNGYLTCVFMNSEYVRPGSGPAKDVAQKIRATTGPLDNASSASVILYIRRPEARLC